MKTNYYSSLSLFNEDKIAEISKLIFSMKIETEGISQKEFAKILNISKTSVSNILLGRKKINLESGFSRPNFLVYC